MIPARSDVLDFDEEEQTSTRRRAPTMVSLHFIRSALRRRWLVCVLSAVLGMVAAAGFLVAFPVVHNARTTLLLAHEPEVEPTRAMATDVSLLRTRTVASTTIARLGLTMPPDDFIKSVTVVSDSSELLELKLTAPTDAEAERRLSALADVYLKFRGEQLSAQSNALVGGMQERIQKLTAEVEGLSKRVEDLSAETGSGNAGKLSDTISQRAYVQGRIDNLQQEVEDATLRNRAVVSSSVVLDAPAAEVGGVKRRIALALASGLIGGTAIGCGVVLFFAIISDRLRRRSDVVGALEVPVPVSVRRIAPVPERLARLPLLRTLDVHRRAERLRLAHAIEMELPEPGRSGRLAVLCIDNAEEVRFAMAAAAADLVADGRSVVLIDLTSTGNLDSEVVPSKIGSTPGPTVLRPRGLPTLAGDLSDLRVRGDENGAAPSLEAADVILVLADLDPSVGTDYLLTWTERVIIAVTAGRSSAEMVRSSADLVRSSGLELRVAALLHTERTDDSSGTAGFDRPLLVHAPRKQDRLALVGTPLGAGAQAATPHEDAEDGIEVVAHQEPIRDKEGPTLNEEAAGDQMEQPVDEELTANDETTHDDELTGKVEQATEEEQPAEEPAQLADKEQLDHLAALEQPATEQVAEKAQLAEEEQPAAEQAQTQVAEQAQVAEKKPARRRRGRRGKTRPPRQEQVAKEEPLAVEGHPTADEDQLAVEHEEPTARAKVVQGDPLSAEAEQAVDDDPTVEMQAVVHLEASKVEEQAPVDQEQTPVDQEQAAVQQHAPVQAQRSEDERAIEDDATVLMAAIEEASAEEQAPTVAEPVEIDDGTGWQLFFPENPLVRVQPSPEDDELDWTWNWLDEPNSKQDADSALIGIDDETELLAEPDEVPRSFLEVDGDGWILYLDIYPPAYLESAPTSEDQDLNWDWEWEEEPASNGKQPSNGHDSNVRQEANGHELDQHQGSTEGQQAQADHTSSRV